MKQYANAPILHPAVKPKLTLMSVRQPQIYAGYHSGRFSWNLTAQAKLCKWTINMGVNSFEWRACREATNGTRENLIVLNSTQHNVHSNHSIIQILSSRPCRRNSTKENICKYTYNQYGKQINSFPLSTKCVSVCMCVWGIIPWCCYVVRIKE